ncbi:MAG: hypothetical protein LR001_03835 [Clostridiales bacterium]|nr:hypothetical protein [Clostridiales bacterium]
MTLGIGFKGLLMAANIALRTQSAFTYMIIDNDEKDHDIHENIIEIEENTEVVIVTDVIVSGETLTESIGKLEVGNNIRSGDIKFILALFYRPSGKMGDVEIALDEEIANKVHVLNKDFVVEICSKSECLFNECS